MKNRNIRWIAAVMAAALAMTGCATSTETATSEASTEAVAEKSTEASTESGAEDESKDPFDLNSQDAEEAATETSTEDAAEESTEVSTDAISEGRHRRTLPHKDTTAEADTEEEERENAVAEEYPTSVSEIKRLKRYKGDTVAFNVLKNVKDSVATWEDDAGYPDSQEDMEDMLSGLMAYWGDETTTGNMESVNYLVRMGKYRYLSQMLDGTDDYFYYGDENAEGEPDGLGIAVYADNAYYYGEFENGERSGVGFWYQIFVEDGAYSKANNGIIGHSYSGCWEHDLPNGPGQEHLDIDTEYLRDRIVTNIKTDFVDGYYNGEIIATTLENDEGMTNWTGEARYGTMVVIDGEYVENKEGKAEVRVLVNADNDNNYYWMLMDENCGQGITGLID